jgi:acetyl-CoA C-acetyltransferase
MREVVIIGAARTPIGSFQGELSSLSAPQLGAIAIKAALTRGKVEGKTIDEVMMGCVLPAGVGQAPARQASIGAGIPNTVPAVTVNKVCGSGLKTVVAGAQSIAAGDNTFVVAGGMESMSNAPYYLPAARAGMRMGNGVVVDGMVHDGLWDPYNNFHMGVAGELCAKEKGFTREQQDAYATESYRRARAAIANGDFKAEIVGVPVPQKKGEAKIVDTDEDPGKGDPAKFASLRSAFQKDGTITAANAPGVNDGAAALVLAERGAAEKAGHKPLARIIAYGQSAQAPEWFTTAPAIAIERALKKANLTAEQIDLWEINEAFAVVAMVNNQLLGLDAKKVNIRGGAVALGHPIGASGARVLVTLLHALQAKGGKYGCASLCIGGGEGIALIVERLS